MSREVMEDGWCDWEYHSPLESSLLCCDCGLIHEFDFRVVRYEYEDSEVYEVVDDPNLEVQVRLRRRDDISPKKPHQEKQEPVAWMFVNEDGECEQIEYGPVFDDPGVTPLYTEPPKREWLSLTDQEVWEAIDDVLEGGGWLDVARVLEQAFKEKNNG